jgi:hypothetical protein
MPTATETNTESPPLSGTSENPARDPSRSQPKEGPGSMGDIAFRDAVMIVAIAWAVMLFLAWSLRHHNV